MFNAHSGETCAGAGFVLPTELLLGTALFGLPSVTSLMPVLESSILNGFPFASKLQFFFFFMLEIRAGRKTVAPSYLSRSAPHRIFL